MRVECKTSRLVGEALLFRTCSNTNNVPREYAGEIDVFGVYSPTHSLVSIVPACGLPARICSLRLSPTRNGQGKRVWWAKDYLLGPP